jgi:hypothetical protein
MIGGRVAYVVERFACNRDDMRVANFERVRCFDVERKLLRRPAKHSSYTIRPARYKQILQLYHGRFLRSAQVCAENSASRCKRNAARQCALILVKDHCAKQCKNTQKSRASIRNPLLYPAELRAHHRTCTAFRDE